MKETICYAILHLAEGLTAAVYFNNLFELKSKKNTLILKFILGYLTLFLIFQFDNLIINVISFLIVNAMLLYTSYFCKIWLSILHSAYLSFAMLITEFLTVSILAFAFHDYNAYSYNFIALICSGALSKFSYFFIAAISSKILKSHHNQVDLKKFLLFSLLPIASIIIAIAYIHIGLTTVLSSMAEIMMTTSVLFLLVSNILSFILLDHMQTVMQENFSMQLILQKEQADAEYYDMLQKQYDQQRILIHDIKNHLHMIHGFLQAGKLPELEWYLSEFESLPALQKSMHFCENTVCNMILIQTAEQCKEKGIDFQADIREQSISFLEFTDITSLFGNLLSNAVEAAENSAEKMVDLSVRSQKDQGITLITVKNSCDQPPAQGRSGQFLTRKADKASHGIGLKSIQRIAKKYNGDINLYYNPEEKQFHATIMLKQR